MAVKHSKHIFIVQECQPRADQLLHQSIQRPFPRGVEQQVGGKIEIEPRVIAVVTGGFHSGVNTPERIDIHPKDGIKSWRDKILPHHRNKPIKSYMAYKQYVKTTHQLWHVT